MNKGPDAFRTISEVADDLDVPQHVLRFWETRFSTIRPLKRGGGRRYYRPDDVDLLKGIRQLLYGQGYTIRGVQRILKEGGSRFVQDIGRGEQVMAPLGTRPPVFDEPDAEEAEAEAGWDDPAGLEPDAPPRGAVRPVPDDAGSAPVPGPRVQAAYSSPTQGRDRLRAALDDLLECRRILDSLKRG